MSRSAALAFINRLDSDLALQSRLRNLRPGDLDGVVRVGVEAGFDFDVDDLRAAFGDDWKMRRRFYGGD